MGKLSIVKKYLMVLNAEKGKCLVKMEVFRERMEWYDCIYGSHGAINVTVGEREEVSSKKKSRI